ncbi:MAG: ferredoxin--NADP reductase [Candidatus Marinimicrobia bacterium]|jgi:ferredoxin--NADP+ reductase|nr:ferredoxin--NADP reductase [Candidatus Neomarinimicrobiota bacterium]MBT3574717.1 ferredoxin--NADP reductase [Candidatus Neomarinimicrobiota bacterium]MBT3680552.1 ferredoxin--NADP reductase [Candidatus Neomarinimicrobiota bacterium]MBT3951998.1 ferredoxin--NADP reductase [Candidatus Neomarinimicrobiota bacterium]MBT4252567.1 ferredoxin--NADP reductase [Candidatus Neomarinimicrobiota bacterium]
MADLSLNAVVSQKIEVSPGLIILRVVPQGWELPDYKAGQFTVLGLPGTSARHQFSDEEVPLVAPEKLIRRAYSVSSASVNKEYIEFYITMVRSGALTPRIFALETGDKIFLSKKFSGVFTLEMTEPSSNIIMLGTGTGLAPYMSMLREDLPCNSDRKYIIVHGARHSWDLGYRSELNTIANVCSNFTYIPAITRPNLEHIEWGGESGYIQELWERKVIQTKSGLEPTPENTHIFLCGNPSMIDTMVEVLELEGYKEHSKKSPGQIHLERYW